MSIPARRGDTLKKQVFSRDEAKMWLLKKKQIDSEIVSGESGEAFAVYFFPTPDAKNANLKKLIGNVAQLLDLDKPYANISSIRFEKYRNKTALRIGWASEEEL